MLDIKPYLYGNIKLGRGSFILPPILIGTIFYQGQSIVDRKNSEIFNAEKAKKRIDAQISLSNQYKIPNLIEINAFTPEAMVKYLEFFLNNYDLPFVLGGTFDSKVAGIEYLNDNGIGSDKYIYNAISDLKNKKELELLQKYKIQSIVILILGTENMTSTQRYAYITEKNQPNDVNLIEGLNKLGIEKIWVDGGVTNIGSLAHILEAQQLISKSLFLPVGTASNLFLFKYSSPRLNVRYHTRYRRASIMFVATWYSNFIFYGSIEDAKECFASAYQALEFKGELKKHNLKFLD